MTDLTIVESLISDLRERVTSLEEQQIDTDKALAWVTGVAADVKGLNLDGLFRRVTALEAQQAKLIEIVDRGLVSASIAETAPAEGPANDAEALPPAPQRGPQTEAPIEIRVGQRYIMHETGVHYSVTQYDGEMVVLAGPYGQLTFHRDDFVREFTLIREPSAVLSKPEPHLTRSALLAVADDLCKTNLFDRDEADYDEDDAVAALLRALAEVEPEVWAQITDTLLDEGYNEDKSMSVFYLLAEMGEQ